MSNEKIAIVGIGIIAPEAADKDQFWKNVTSGKNCISEVPKDRWDWELYYSDDHKAADKTYSKIGGFIKDFTFNPIKYKIPPQTAAQISRLQQMTIEAVRMAFEDSGYDKKPFDPRMTAAVIGNAMGAMRKELTDLRVYKFYNEDLLKKTGAFAALQPAQQKALLEEYEGQIDKNILKITEDTMPGELSNVTAGRIANVFNLNGPNMTMDAACASSLAALDYAVMGLRAGKFDMAVTGGADEMMSAPAFVKFCKIGALSADGSYSFDERANGFVMAEAVAVYILKRYSDAVRDGDKIYALINSVGASSDGKGKGITAPNPKGQKMAIENAFAQVDYGPGEVDFVEAHGTATRVGDAAEVEALRDIFGPHIKSGRKLGLTSIKSQIGHAKAAAGAVSMVKTALALHHKMLPTSINCVTPNPAIDLNLFKVITKAEPWETTGLRRANVSSFGFGGTNFHVTMEEYAGQPTGKQLGGEAARQLGSQQISSLAGQPSSRPAAQPVVENPKTPFSGLQGEAITFTAGTPQAVMAEAKALSESVFSRWPETYPMSLFATEMNARPQQEWGVSLVAKTPADLREKIAFLTANAKPETWDAPPLNFRLKGVYTFRRKKHDAKIGFLFPGQGSQYVDMMRDLAAKYEVVQATFDEADRILEKMIGVNLTGTLWSKPGESKEELEQRENAIKQTQMTQPAMMTADMAMFRLLISYGIKPDMVIGHSLGEYAAATAAGVFTLENGLRAVTSRAKEMSSVKVKDPGKMASIAWPAEKVDRELKKIAGYVICANKNCPQQTVIAGEREAVEKAVALFTSLGVQAQEIAVSHAFHSAIIEPAIGPYRRFLENIPTAPWTIPLLSNVTADYFPADKQATYDLLLKQMTSPVEFIKQMERMYADGVRTFIECGPKRVLSAFATSTLKDKPGLTILSSNHPKRGGITEFNDLLANLMALGFTIDWKGKHPEQGKGFFNPYYQNWAQQLGGEAASQLVSQTGQQFSSPAVQPSSRPAVQLSFAERYGFNPNNIAVSGIAGGAPGTWDKLFREHTLDEILAGKNMIEPIPMDWREKQIDKNILRVIKSPTGNHSIAKIDSVDQAIKLSARKGSFDLEKEFGVPNNIAKALDTTFKMAMAAGVLALKDAGLPLIHYYKKTTTGGYLPEKWALPEPLASETGVIFASAFPVMESLINEIAGYFNYKYRGKTAAQMWEVYDTIIGKLQDPKDKQALRSWMEQNFDKTLAAKEKDMYTFSQNFLMKVIPIADSQLAQWVGAKGPAMHISAACASTTQAVHTAECWLRAGKAKRVVIIAADDITNNVLQEWTMPGFLASGTATTKENVSEAALPFDRRRDGLIVGSAAVGMVIEDETLVRNRGMKPLARLLLTESANSAYHVSRLDTDHVAEVMEKFVKKVEAVYGLDKSSFAAKTFFMSHETYTPARGGSASAEVKALKKAFGAHAKDVVISNVKGFTGHTMGASLEEVVAVRALNTGIIPPIANYKEPDPELDGITLSKGGKYDLQYALRFAAGFGSHMAMSFMERVFKEGEKRIEDTARHNEWLKAITGEEHPELEVVLNTLRIKDKRTAGKPTHTHTPAKEPVTAAAARQLVGETAGQPAGGSASQLVSEAAPAIQPNTPAVQPSSRPAVQPSSRPAAQPLSLSQDEVQAEILNMIAGKTGYPLDMLELDLDMEADLGIDTVKQAELFAAIREHYNIAKKDNLSLKDYPTIRHCIRFVIDAKTLAGETASQLASQTVQQNASPAVQPSSSPAVQPVSAQPSSRPAAQQPSLSQDEVRAEILNMIAGKTGYPIDMLELDLDMEADLGIDTVKQAELFAAIREHYNIAKKDNLSLKDYPTIRHCIRFVIDAKTLAGGTASQLVSETAPAVQQSSGPAVQPVSAPVSKPSSSPAVQPTSLSQDKVQAEILNMIAGKTGYPIDMLELDLDMEADLGIDTVKQAELFAAMREHYNIARKDNLSLKDYPTIRHCIRFVMDATQLGGEAASQLPSQTVQQNASPAVQPSSRPAVQPVSAQPSSRPAVQPSTAPVQPSSLSEDSVQAEILTMIAEKTGYPKDMLELDLDMEADLGIDTVKQAELFAAMREHYNIARKDNLSLKDYPTIRHCIRFVMEAKGAVAAPAGQLVGETAGQPAIQQPVSPAAQPSSRPTAQPAPLTQPLLIPDESAAPTPAPAVKPSSSPAIQPSSLSEDSVQAEILTMIADKTGYPKDMLELDLDMEADLGIDTVKQAELFAAMREHYNIARKDNLSLKDYPTIRHCIRFVMDAKQPAEEAASQLASQTVQQNASPADQPPSRPAAQPVSVPAVQPSSRPAVQPVSAPAAQPSSRPADQPAPAAKPVPASVAQPAPAPAVQPPSRPAAQPAPAAQQSDTAQPEAPVHPKRHIRYVPTIIPAPVENEVITKLSPKRPVVIFGEDLDLIKAFRSELNKHRIDSFAFTSAKTKLKDTIQVDFKDMAAVEKAIAEFAAAHDNVQGVFYLMGCVIKSLSAETNAFEDLKRYTMPLFLAGKYFNAGLNKLEPGTSTFLAVLTTLDGGFGYKTREVYDPVYGAIHGLTLCLRKELEHSIVKLLDFEPHASSQTMVQKAFYEILYSDKRLAAGYADNKRWTLIGKPELLEKDRERTPLKDKKVLITGGGRGLGGLFAKTIAARHKPHIVILDIIELNSDSARYAAMSEDELKAYKTGPLWTELKTKIEKATPAILEKEFTRIKDSAQLYRSIAELKALGVAVSYYRCDLNNKEAFDSVMTNIKADLGQVDGVVHFAGLERSKLVVDKTVEEFLLIFNTKSNSAINMLKSGIVKEKGFWVMASSIAGKFGNLGQSDYAAASDYIAKLCVSLTNKGVRAFSVDMSAYANIGMGIRPGVEAFLKSQELDFLYPEEGMNAMADELVYGRVPEIILSGSLGKLDWDKQLRFDPNFPDAGGTEFHFLERASKKVKGLELEAVKELSLEKDPYLADHAINGTPYLPGVMGIETFAEAAAAVSGENPKALKDLRFTVPIKLLRGKPVEALIRANAHRGGYDMKIESDFVNAKGVKLGSTKTHFSARYEPGPVKGGWEGLAKPELPKHAKYKITAEEIYKIYFHGPSFRVLDGILSIEKNAVLGVFKKPVAALWRIKTPALLFHPMVLEALFQTCGWRDIHFDRKMMLPDAVGTAIVYDNNPDPDRLYTYGVYKGTTEDGKTRYDAYAFDSEMRPVAELKDYLMIPTQI